MRIDEFKASLKLSMPPKGMSILLQAMWHDAKGDWEKAHELAQNVDTPDGSLVHGYLHLREGDRSNASYWYNHAGESLPSSEHEAEWERLVKKLL